MKSTEHKITTLLVEVSERELLDIVRTAATNFIKNDYIASRAANLDAVALTIEKNEYGCYQVLVQVKDVGVRKP